MALSRAQEIRVGVIAVLAVVILIGGIVWGKGFGLGVDNRSITIAFPSAAGVEPGTAVTFHGVRVGSVTAVRITEKGVLVDALIQKNLPLRRDASAIVTMLELTGGKKIELIAGNAPAPLPPSSVIEGKVVGDVAELLGQVGEIGTSADLLVRRLDSAAASVNRILASRNFAADLDATVGDLRDAAGSARRLVVTNEAALQNSLNNLRDASTQVRALLERTGPSIERSVGGAEATIVDARRTLARLDTTLRSLDVVVADVGSALDEARHGKGAVAKLLNDPQFAAELDSTLQMVQNLIRDIQRNGVKVDVDLF